MSRRTVSILQALAALLFSVTATAGEPLWIDVRSPAEYRESHIADDPNVPHTEIALKIESLAPSKDTEIVLYCARGGRAGIAAKTLESLGYTNVRNAGGIADARRERGCDAPGNTQCGSTVVP